MHKKYRLLVMLVAVLLTLTLSGCDLPWAATLEPTPTASLAPSQTATDAPPTGTAEPVTAGTETATLSAYEMGPDAYYEYLAPIRMREFEVAYNDLARITEQLSANLNLLYDQPFREGKLLTAINTISDSADSLTMLVTDVVNGTGKFPTKYAPVEPCLLDLYDKTRDLHGSFYRMIINTRRRTPDQFSTALEHMIIVADTYGTCVDTYHTAGGPDF